MKDRAIAVVMRPDGAITARVRGWSATHVLFDVNHTGDKTWTKNFSRPILGFMLDFGLL